LIAHETDPVKKNISQAKKEAVLLINDGVNPRILVYTLCAFLMKELPRKSVNFVTIETEQARKKIFTIALYDILID